MIDMNDLDRAALRRTIQAGHVPEDVDEMYLGVLTVPMMVLVKGGVPYDVLERLFRESVRMIYADLDRRDAGLDAIGGATLLAPRFQVDLGGDEQFVYHVCRIVLFAVSGIVEPGHEEDTLAYVDVLKGMYALYTEVVR